jgi:hypothetical protein
MKEFWIVVLSAGVASVTSWGGVFLNSFLTEKRERRQYFHKSESERLQLLEERAGVAVELVHIMPLGAVSDTELGDAMKQLGLDAGRFGRYQSLSSSIRALHNSAMWLVRQKHKYEDARAAEKEMHEAYSTVLRMIKELR